MTPDADGYVTVLCPRCHAPRRVKADTCQTRWYAKKAGRVPCVSCSQKAAGAKRAKVAANRRAFAAGRRARNPVGLPPRDTLPVLPLCSRPVGWVNYTAELLGAERDPGDAAAEKAYRAELDKRK